ncbi:MULTISPECIES: TetR/AcrR family transcriptional regulator C-terminal domain-containing protein [Agrococcus]|uniref:TetR/AcrR family transcriptional regulator C-terminal domain-containing protein n=1 Tax=Agrococcus TaxID=46352 RepID=UPI000B836FB0|nr:MULTISPECIES: TetR/AcrR family transcriptional regulator C-terminal domain-containing protein [Agrococcus]
MFEHGPARAIEGVEQRLTTWVERGALPAHDVQAAAQQYNWLVMGGPLNAAMLLGDEAIPTPAKRRTHASSAVAAFLRSIGAAA